MELRANEDRLAPLAETSPTSATQAKPWEYVLALVRDIKQGRQLLRVPILDDAAQDIGSLVPLTVAHLGDTALLERFVRWRNQNREGWLDQRSVTLDGTRRWLDQVVHDPYRMSFLLYARDSLVGRCGFLNLTPDENESDGLVRGESGGGYYFMRHAQIAGLHWQFDELGIQSVWSKVVSTNERALDSCRLLGYSMQPFAEGPVYQQAFVDGVVLSETGRPEQWVAHCSLLFLRLTKRGFFEALASMGSTSGA